MTRVITIQSAGEELQKAGAGATAEIFSVLKRTQAEASQEMKIIGFPFTIP
ncbi:hypothetical protein [Hyphomicrobium sp. 2TAF46]|uniref:hypothetical protein n=1 Tax=Hyphomicrobium sp. 2TAF46 TaxID=3233019 RepID=UPI003F9177FA